MSHPGPLPAGSVAARALVEARASLARPTSPGAPVSACGLVRFASHARGCTLPGSSPPRAAPSISGPRWSQVVPAPLPYLDSPNAVFDTKDGYVVLFGGQNLSGSGNTSNSTWEFNGAEWLPLHPSVHPADREAAAMVYDAGDGYVLMFGGLTYAYPPLTLTALSDTWKFSGGTWTLVKTAATVHPPASYASSIAYDAKDGYVVLFGGTNGTGTMNATWTYHGGRWTQLKPAASPPSRAGAAANYDPGSASVVVFGGYDATSPRNDTWSFRAGNWSSLSTPVAPSVRSFAAFGYDQVAKGLVLFGGTSWNASGYTTYGDSWIFAHSQWTKFGVVASPPARCDSFLTAGSKSFPSVLMAGTVVSGSNGIALNDSWTLSGTSWTKVRYVTPPSRAGPAMAYDGADGYVVMFGGNSSSGSILGDTWIFARGVWHPAKSTVSPSARRGAGMVYDSSDGYLLLFGGVSASGATLSDTWEFAKGQWTHPNVTGAPPGRSRPAIADDPADGYVLMFGGTNSSSGPIQDTWTYVSGAWTTPPSYLYYPPPSARYSSSMSYDSYDGVVVLFGGYSTAGAGHFAHNDTWEWGGSFWTNVTSPSTGTPGRIGGAAMVDDTGDGYVLLFGGAPFAGVPTNATWSFSANAWHRLSPSSRPPGLVFAGGAYDATDTVVLVFGGYASGTIATSGTWQY